MISAELAAHPISTKRGLTALCRRASHRGISYYIRYETQTYSLTAINLRLELRIVVGRCILFIPRTSTSPIVIGKPMPVRHSIALTSAVVS